METLTSKREVERPGEAEIMGRPADAQVPAKRLLLRRQGVLVYDPEYGSDYIERTLTEPATYLASYLFFKKKY